MFSPAVVMTLREQFPALQGKTYLNFGGQGPLPSPAWQAIQDTYQKMQAIGPFSQQGYVVVGAKDRQLRQALGQVFQVGRETIALTDSVTTGCNIALWGLAWRPGDHLVLTDCEHPGVLAIAQQLQARFGVETTIIPLLDNFQAPPEALVALFTAALTPKTRMVVLSHLLWNTGTVLPLQEINTVCHERGVLVLVDAAQSVGVLPLDLPGLDVDFYAFTGHKWLCGPDGLGGLYIAPQHLESLLPTYVGWRSINNGPQGFLESFKTTAAKFEVATSAFPLMAGLETAIEVHTQAGTTADRYQQICDLSAYLWQNLQGIPGVQCLTQTPPPSGLVTFQLASGQHVKLVDWLEQRGILVRLLLFPNSVRACVHYMSLPSECDQLVAAIQEFLRL